MKRFLLSAVMLGLVASANAFGASYGFVTITNNTATAPNINTNGTVPGAGPTYAGDYDIFVNTVDAAGVSNGFGGLAGNWHEVYCVDLTNTMNTGTFEIVDLEDLAQISPQEAVNLRKMVTAAGGIASADSAKGNQQAAAWEIVYETATDMLGNQVLNLSAGAFQVASIGGGPVGGAQTLLNAIASTSTEAEVFALYNATNQDWAVFVKGGGETEVPEPMALVNLLGLAMVGGALVGCRRFRS